MQHEELRSNRGSRLVNESSSRSHPSTSMTPSRQERNHPTSSSSSSSSPTTTAPSNSEIRERDDQSGIDSLPPVSSSNVEEMIERRDPLFAAEPGMRSQANQNLRTNKEETTIERRNPLFADSSRAPLCSEIPEWLQEFRKNVVDDEIPVHGDSHARSSHEVSLERISKRSEELGKHSVKTYFLKTEIARSVRGPKLQGPRAEDALAEPFLVQKILVTW